MICLISELPIVDYSRRALCSRRCPSLGMRAMTISPSSGHIARGGKRRWYRVGRPGVRKVVLRVINLSEVRDLPSYVFNAVKLRTEEHSACRCCWTKDQRSLAVEFVLSRPCHKPL